jgi:hypothetical protein
MTKLAGRAASVYTACRAKEFERRSVWFSVPEIQQKRFYDGFRPVYDGFLGGPLSDSLDESRADRFSMARNPI